MGVALWILVGLWLVGSVMAGVIRTRRLHRKAGARNRRCLWLDPVRLSFHSADSVVAAGEGALLTLAFLAMVGLYFHHMVDGSLTFEGKLATFLMLWVGFLGASLATREKKHLAVEALFKALPFRYKPLLRILAALVATGTALVLAILAWNFTVSTYNLRSTEEQVLIPLQVVTALNAVPEALNELRPLAGETLDYSFPSLVEGKPKTVGARITFPVYETEPDPVLGDQQWTPKLYDAEGYSVYGNFVEADGFEEEPIPQLGIRLDGRRVIEICSDSPAERHGLCVNDLLWSYHPLERKRRGEVVVLSGQDDLRAEIATKRPGHRIRLGWLRHGAQPAQIACKAALGPLSASGAMAAASLVRFEKRDLILGPYLWLVGLPKWIYQSIMPLSLLIMALRFFFGDALASLISVVQNGWEATGRALVRQVLHESQGAPAGEGEGKSGDVEAAGKPPAVTDLAPNPVREQEPVPPVDPDPESPSTTEPTPAPEARAEVESEPGEGMDPPAGTEPAPTAEGDARQTPDPTSASRGADSSAGGVGMEPPTSQGEGADIEGGEGRQGP